MKKIIILIIILQAILAVACIHKEQPSSAKPKGYFRIETPKPEYQKWDSLLPFSFEYSKYAQFSFEEKEPKIYWMDLRYPQYNVSLKMSIFPLKDSLRKLIVNEEKMLMFHVESRKADDILYSDINDTKEKVYGQMYELVGKGAATPLKFWITDSTRYFVSASLYFNFPPNNDSLQPVINYLKTDVLHLIETWKWK
jgi:gliding motility-associated lipoprotein GldD